ncbi:HEAT repeat domain-containing protein, partial [Candidatus Shapirobacteria bacterium]|nr:HEAT repeat domain-containing protein [Candidatus Shapirobacteria bacterium]
MPEFSLEKPPTEKVRELAQELHKQGLEPRLTFLSPINETRKNALEMIRDGKPDPKMVVELLESTDFIEREAGAYLSGNITGISEKDRPNILSILEELGKSEDFYTQKVAIRALGNQGEEALPILEELSK